MPIVSFACIKMKISFLTVLIILTSGHSVECYSDTCNYNNNGAQYLCGNVCLDDGDRCDCGDQYNRWGFNGLYYCCAPASACNSTQTAASCSSGEVLMWDSPTPCNATRRCFNDILTSQHLSYHAHYTCQDKCIPWWDMCLGVSHCVGDEEACGPELRCPVGSTRFNMSTIPVRYYCYRDYDVLDRTKYNGSYELLDRSDESLSMPKVSNVQSINYTALTRCTKDYFRDEEGVSCDGDCEHTANWCNDKVTVRFCADSGVWKTDPRLCSHPTFWEEISCNMTYGHLYPGFRCTGTIKHCYYPKGTPNYPTTCRDKSDRVFQVGEPCPDMPDTPYRVDTSDNICWESCDKPGPNCTACSNKTYFRCPQTNKCFHPSLKCDGIPQCQGVDEDLDECKQQYQNNDAKDGRHKISQYATIRCHRTLYPELETYATACDGIHECFKGEDEKNCNNTSDFIKISLVSISAMYLVLKYGRKLFKKLLELFKNKTHNDIKRRFNNIMTLNDYFEKHDEDDAIEKINLLLLNTIYTKKCDETKIIGRHIYALEEAKHKSQKNEIFACMHRNMDPLIMQTVIDSKFSGLTEKAIQFIESCCCGRWITDSIDYIRAHEWLTDLMNTIKRLVKIELQYLDVVKDSFLTYSLYRIVGDHQAIYYFHTEFSIVVVLCLAASVVVPVMFATLHLVVHNPFLIVTTSDKEQTGWRRATMTLVCCCLSFLKELKKSQCLFVRPVLVCLNPQANWSKTKPNQNLFHICEQPPSQLR